MSLPRIQPKIKLLIAISLSISSFFAQNLQLFRGPDINPSGPGLFQEGGITFQIGSAFYRRDSSLSRDLGVLAAKVYRQRQRQLTVLDAMSGCGVRSLRYGIEADADWVWVNESNPDLESILRLNLQILTPQRWQLTLGNALQVFRDCAALGKYFDLVDLDGFGSPAAFLAPLIPTVRLGGLIYATTTDSRTLAGHHSGHSLRQFGTYARAHPAVHEQGLRILIGTLMQQALFQGFTVQPVFSLFHKAIYRVMVRLVPVHCWHERQFGFLGYCHRCGHYETVGWRSLSRAQCPQTHQPLTLSGPMWLGPLHETAYLHQMTEQAQSLGWTHCIQLLQTMTAEADLPPYFYALAELGRRGKMNIPNRDKILSALQNSGYRSVRTHIDDQAIKTEASFQSCLTIAQAINAKP